MMMMMMMIIIIIIIIIIDSAVKNVIKIGGISGICCHLDGVGWDWFITCWLIC